MDNDEFEMPDLSPQSPKERLAGIGEFGLAVLGGGPGMAGYLLGRVRRSRDQSIPETLHAIVRRLQAVEDRIQRDDPTMEADVEEILEKAWARKQRDKVDYWAAAAAHTATNEGPDIAERKRMIDTLDRLRLSHLRLLHLVSLSQPPEGWGGGNMDAYLAHGIPGVDLTLAKLDWSDLHTAGVLPGYPGGMTTTAEHWQLANQGIPPFGRRFVEFIEA